MKSFDVCRWARRALVMGTFAALTLACGGDDGEGPAADSPDAAVDEVLLPPPGPGEGVQFEMVTELGPGVEAEHCQFVKAPTDGLFVNRDEVRFTPGSHHFLLYETAYTEIPTQKEDGTPVDTSGVFDCSDGPTAGWRITKLVGGSQNGEGDAMLSFPPDVAMPIAPGAVLLMNAHYINASDQPLEPEVYINLYTIAEADMRVEGDILFLYNPFIKVPAGGEGRARWRCPVHTDITITNVQSHMHARGVGYAATVEGADEPFYTNTLWADVPVQVFEPGMEVSAGSRLDYWCDYQNSEARDVYQGTRSTDEMCMLVGSYYPADPATANCNDAAGNLAGEWVGNGTAKCHETWTCLQAAFQQSPVIPGITDCMLDASPDVAAEASALLRCFAANGPGGSAACQAEIAACEADADPG